MQFSDLALDARVLQAIEEAGYTSPTPIQAAAIPFALQGRDVLGIAQTGTGKTASFTLPMLTLLAQGRAKARMPRSLILCPTRELAAQVAENFDIYGKYLNLTKALLIGGVSFGDQEKLIDRGVDVLIATPGRLLDHFERGKLMLTGVQVMVVDEADRMLDMGFIPDIERIFNLTPFTRQTLFFSATMPPEITKLTETFLHNPERVEVAKASSTADTVAQRLVRFRASHKTRIDKEKRAALRQVIAQEGEALRNAIIFCNRKSDVSIVHKSMEVHGYNAGALHGDLDQSVRMRVLDGFRNGQLKFLIASDVAARGLDIPNVSHVINYDVPIHAEDYVHRIGRTGRAGREGIAYTLATPEDDKFLARIKELIGKEIPPYAVPGITDREPGEATEERREEGNDRKRRDDRRRRGTEPAPEGSETPRRAKVDAARPEEGEQPHRERRERRPVEILPVAIEVDNERPVLIDGFGTRNNEPKRTAEPARNHRDGNREVNRDLARREGGRRREEDLGPSPLGFGDHVPAFVLRAVVLNR